MSDKRTIKDIESIIDKYLDKEFKKRFKEQTEDDKFTRTVKEITTDVLEDFYQLMWTRKSFWKNNINK